MPNPTVRNIDKDRRRKARLYWGTSMTQVISLNLSVWGPPLEQLLTNSQTNPFTGQ